MSAIHCWRARRLAASVAASIVEVARELRELVVAGRVEADFVVALDQRRGPAREGARPPREPVGEPGAEHERRGEHAERDRREPQALLLGQHPLDRRDALRPRDVAEIADDAPVPLDRLEDGLRREVRTPDEELARLRRRAAAAGRW